MMLNDEKRPSSIDEKATIESIQEFLSYISSIADDEEMAHIEEDHLYKSVLEAIAEGCDNAKELAIEALKCQEIDFVRYYT